MKEFILGEKEEILAEFTEVLVRANENNFKLNVILTNNRIVLLKDVSKELLMNEFLRARLIDVHSNLEIVLNIPFDEIKELKYVDGINKITFKDNNNEIDIKCDDFKSFRIQV